MQTRITKSENPDLLDLLISMKTNINEMIEHQRSLHLNRAALCDSGHTAAVYFRDSGLPTCLKSPRDEALKRCVDNMVWRRSHIGKLLEQFDAQLSNQNIDQKTDMAGVA